MRNLTSPATAFGFSDKKVSLPFVFSEAYDYIPSAFTSCLIKDTATAGACRLYDGTP